MKTFSISPLKCIPPKTHKVESSRLQHFSRMNNMSMNANIQVQKFCFMVNKPFWINFDFNLYPVFLSTTPVNFFFGSIYFYFISMCFSFIWFDFFWFKLVERAIAITKTMYFFGYWPRFATEYNICIYQLRELELLVDTVCSPAYSVIFKKIRVLY